MKIWVAGVESESGVDVTVHSTREGAVQSLFNFVCNWWEYEGLEGEIPEDKEEAIRAYFETVEDEHGYIIGAAELDEPFQYQEQAAA